MRRRRSVVVLVCIAGRVYSSRSAPVLVRVGRPVVRVTVRFEVGGNRGVVRVVCRHRDVIEVCPLGIEASASVGLLSCQPDRDQIETRFVEGDAAVRVTFRVITLSGVPPSAVLEALVTTAVEAWAGCSAIRPTS